MFRRSLLCMVLLAACGSVKETPADAPTPDAPGPDAPPACQPKMLLVGGTDVAPQGWSVQMQAPATLSYELEYVKLVTSTITSATSGGQLLLYYPDAVEAGRPFKFQVVMAIDHVDAHKTTLDSAAAIMGSFTPNFGTQSEREQMIYLDPGKIGWADDIQAFTAPAGDSVYHTYELSVDAGGTAQVTFDGIAALARNGFISNGAIAIGDQTNDLNVNSTLRIHSVTKLCP